jgi:arylsulfatase A-like enzyme
MFDLGESLTRAVLLARGPGFAAGAVDDRLAQVSDVYPTLLGAAGLEVGSVPGRDLRTPGDPERVLLARVAWPREFLGQFPDEVLESGALAPHLRALWASWDGRYKLVVGSDGSEAVYDLSSDPDELRPLEPVAVPAERLERLRARIAASRSVHDGVTWSEEGVDGDVDEAALEALRALGYAR